LSGVARRAKPEGSPNPTSSFFGTILSILG
jgi:hypothetical protein